MIDWLALKLGAFVPWIWAGLIGLLGAIALHLRSKQAGERAAEQKAAAANRDAIAADATDAATEQQARDTRAEEVLRKNAEIDARAEELRSKPELADEDIDAIRARSEDHLRYLIERKRRS
jgi:hypothetical protein